MLRRLLDSCRVAVVSAVRSPAQEEAAQRVNIIIAQLAERVEAAARSGRDVPVAEVRAHLNAAEPEPVGIVIDERFQSIFLGLSLEDQKAQRTQLRALLARAEEADAAVRRAPRSAPANAADANNAAVAANDADAEMATDATESANFNAGQQTRTSRTRHKQSKAERRAARKQRSAKPAATEVASAATATNGIAAPAEAASGGDASLKHALDVFKAAETEMAAADGGATNAEAPQPSGDGVIASDGNGAPLPLSANWGAGDAVADGTSNASRSNRVEEADAGAAANAAVVTASPTPDASSASAQPGRQTTNPDEMVEDDEEENVAANGRRRIVVEDSTPAADDGRSATIDTSTATSTSGDDSGDDGAPQRAPTKASPSAPTPASTQRQGAGPRSVASGGGESRRPSADPWYAPYITADLLERARAGWPIAPLEQRALHDAYADAIVRERADVAARSERNRRANLERQREAERQRALVLERQREIALERQREAAEAAAAEAAAQRRYARRAPPPSAGYGGASPWGLYGVDPRMLAAQSPWGRGMW